MLYVTLLLIIFINSSIQHADSNGKGFKFVGSEYWSDDYIEQCKNSVNPNTIRSDLLCYIYFINFEKVQTEILSRQPLLVVYRDFATVKERSVFLHEIDEKTLEYQKVVDNTEGSVQSKSRQANGTWFNHEESSGSSSLYRKASRLIPSINFNPAELWQVLSYQPGGHYAPHYDFLEYEDESEYDYWMNNYGNRFATFLLILKTADVGGGTLFPLISTVVVPQPGDAVLWLNMTPERDLDNQSLHAACPIMEGNKVAATLWIRERGQELRSKQNHPEFHKLECFVKPKDC